MLKYAVPNFVTMLIKAINKTFQGFNKDLHKKFSDEWDLIKIVAYLKLSFL